MICCSNSDPAGCLIETSFLIEAVLLSVTKYRSHFACLNGSGLRLSRVRRELTHLHFSCAVRTVPYRSYANVASSFAMLSEMVGYLQVKIVREQLHSSSSSSCTTFPSSPSTLRLNSSLSTAKSAFLSRLW